MVISVKCQNNVRILTKGDDRLFGECHNQRFNQSRIRRIRLFNNPMVSQSRIAQSQFRPSGSQNNPKIGLIWILLAWLLFLAPAAMTQPDPSKSQNAPNSLESPNLPESPDMAIPGVKLPGIGNQTDPIVATVYVGVDPEQPTRREESWVPLTVELENRKEAVKGRLVVRMKGGSVEYSTPINLPTKAKKSYDLTVFFPQSLDELEFYIQDGKKETQVQILTSTAQYSETDRFVAVISAERGSHEHFARRPEDKETEMYRRVRYTDPAFLPRYPAGYQSVDVLVWDGGSTTAMSPDQDAALEAWIQMGGTLILAAGEFWQQLNNSPFRLYTPLTLSSSRVLEAGTQLDNPFESEKPSLRSSLVIAVGELIDDPHIKVLLKAGEDPFLVERKWGAGRIVFVASSISNPLFTNPVQETIFKEFLTKSYLPFNGKVVSDLDESITRFLRAIIQAELPGTWFIAIYLGCYILLVVPINYIVFRMLGRLEWAWFTVPVWAIVFAYGAYYIGALRQQGQVAVNEICVVEARPSANAAQSTTYCSIYSPVRNWYSILFKNPVAFPQLLQTNINTGRRQETLSEDKLEIQYTNEGSQIDNFIIYHWSQRSIKTQHVTKIGNGVDIDLKWNNNRITGSITNNTGLSLVEPTIFLKNKQFNIESLENGKTCEVNQDLNTTQQHNPQNYQDRFINQNERNLASFISLELKGVYAAQFFTEYPSLGMSVLAARVEQSQLDFTINNIPTKPKEGQTLLCQIFPLKEQIQGRLLLQNEAFSISNPGSAPGARSQPIVVPGQFRGQGGMGMYGGMPGMEMRRQTEFSTSEDAINNWDFTSDISLAGCKIDSFNIDVNYSRMGFIESRMPAGQAAKYDIVGGKPADPEYEYQVEDLYDRSFHPLSQIVNENGEIINPGRFVDKVTGAISSRIKSPPNRGLRVSLDAIQIRLTINFGTEAGGKFLGYFIDAVAEDQIIPGVQKTNTDDNSNL